MMTNAESIHAHGYHPFGNTGTRDPGPLNRMPTHAN